MSLMSLFASARTNIRYSCVVNILRANCSTSASPPPPEVGAPTPKVEGGDQYEEDIRSKILEASLPFVKDLGWSKEAISAGAEVVGYPGVSHGMFTSAGGDLVMYFQKSSNLKLVEFLKKYNEDRASNNDPPVVLIERACKERLRMTVPYISRWPQALAIMSLPPNVPGSLAALLTMVDDICYHAGDRSVDFSWYARRVALAGVYKASELYLLQDRSADNVETWKFLNRRLTEAVQLHDLISKSEITGQGAKDAVSAAFTTARNILGLNKAT